ncbi:MAG: sigma-54-dependent Fis family transcriptional regulator [Myxococcales bacterium]|nr:sigma-54-dependent Fis family transcriptional regulator [Myxococcales bacterium]
MCRFHRLTVSELTAHRGARDSVFVSTGRRDSIHASTKIPHKSHAEPSDALVPVLTIAAHPDPDRIGDRLVLDRIGTGHEVLLSRVAPDFQRSNRALGAPLADLCLSRTPIRIGPAADGGIRITQQGGSTVVVGDVEIPHVIDLAGLAPGRGVPIVLADRVVLVLHLVEPTATHHRGDAAMDMVGCGLGMTRLRREIGQIADLEAPVLIRGETGTGKERVARALHDSSPRRNGPYVSVNLATLGRELAAAELFGVVRGAFTGAARDREGLFRAAHGGTLFLDEVGEASTEVQAVLLRVLETGQLYPVGGDKPVDINVRVIAATDADLDTQILDGRFKAPLFHRLAGCELYLPPLRDRPEDIGLLFYHFARAELAALRAQMPVTHDPRAGAWLPPSIMVRLLRYRWPGNIRQLRNVARQLVIASRGQSQLRLDTRLAAELDSGRVEQAHMELSRVPESSACRSVPNPRRRPAEISEPELVAALRASSWDLQATADQLRVPRASIYDLIERFPSVRTAGDLAPAEIERCYRECSGDLGRMAAQLEVSRRALGRRVKELGLEPASAIK